MGERELPIFVKFMNCVMNGIEGPVVWFRGLRMLFELSKIFSLRVNHFRIFRHLIIPFCHRPQF